MGDEARFDIKSTTPVSPEKLSAIVDKRMMFLSEFCLGIKLNRESWEKDMHIIIDYLKKIVGLIGDA